MKISEKERVAKSVRLPRRVVQAAERHAQELGLTFAEVVEAGLRRETNMPPNPKTSLLTEIARRLRGRYPDKKGYPQDVTLSVFRDIKKDTSLSQVYDAAVTDASCTVNEDLRWTLHRQIGQLVRRVLDAKVVGRSVELDPVQELIKTHALLIPKG